MDSKPVIIIKCFGRYRWSVTYQSKDGFLTDIRWFKLPKDAKKWAQELCGRYLA